MPKQRSLDTRIKETKAKLRRLELQQRIAELREKVTRDTVLRRRGR